MAQSEPTSGWAQMAERYAAYAVAKNRPYARQLVELAPPQQGERVLDVATGPGVVAVEAARAIPGLDVLATDREAIWEPYVARLAAEAGVGEIPFRAMPAEALDLPDASFDLVYCEFGLMFVPDPVAALREMRRVLRPGGRLAVAVWSGPEKVGHFAAMQALQEALPGESESDPAGFSPLRLGKPGLLRSMVEAAEFPSPIIVLFTEEYEIADPEAEWVRLAAEPQTARRLAERTESERAEVRRRVLERLERFRREGRIRVPSEAVIALAARPASG
ncbi:MAG: methyltransferase domain-containing protein [Thermomicrobiales bacterium]|nr:methyltransferase domain-containing protein [Thermomicrobiales bacterium]